MATEPTLPLAGGCLCGAVRFEVTDVPLRAGYCHCSRCRRRTGTAASVQARLAPGSLRVTQGEDHMRAWQPPDHGFLKVFCDVCGSALLSRDPDDPDIVSVRLGAFDDDPGVRPAYRQHVASQPPWEPIPDDGLPRFSGPRTP